MAKSREARVWEYLVEYEGAIEGLILNFSELPLKVLFPRPSPWDSPNSASYIQAILNLAA